MVKITKEDLDENNYYKHSDSLISDESIEADEDLGYVKFKSKIVSKKYIYFKAGSGIEAGDGIKAGWSIEAGWGIEAGEGIITFYGDLMAKFVSCLRIVVGFNSIEEKTITAKIRKGDIILGRLNNEK